MTPFSLMKTLATADGWVEMHKPGNGSHSDLNWFVQNADAEDAEVEILFGVETAAPTAADEATAIIHTLGNRNTVNGRMVLKGSETLFIRATGADVRASVNGRTGGLS